MVRAQRSLHEDLDQGLVEVFADLVRILMKSSEPGMILHRSL
jgi:hypothetical protein